MKVESSALRWSVLLMGLTALCVRADLPPEAQAAIDKGLVAITQQDYTQADRLFLQDACAKATPSAVYYSLGEAESKIPGRELRAICWLCASLAAKPPVPNAAAVKMEIDGLQAQSRKRILALIQEAEEATQQLPLGEPRNRALQSIAGIWDRWGDEIRARKMIDHIDDKGIRSESLSNLATAYAEKAGRQFEAGDVAGSQTSLIEAQNVIQLIPFPPSKSYPLYRIVEAYLVMARQQMRSGDFAGARERIVTAQRTAADLDASDYGHAESSIATAELSLGRAQLQSGDKAGSRETFALALKMTDQVKRQNEKYEVLMDMADAQTKAGDMADAETSLAMALPLVTVYNDAGHARMEIVRAQVKTRDLVAAQKTAELIVDGQPSWRFDAWRAIAEGQIKTGDLAGARKSLQSALTAVNLYKDNTEVKLEAQRLIADAQTRAGDTAGALTTLAAALKTIDVIAVNSDQKAGELEAISLGQYKAGDKDVAIKTASLIQSADMKSKMILKLSGPPFEVPSIYSEPMEPPRMSEILGLASGINADNWIWMFNEELDTPWFTAYPDFSNYMAMADQILKTPVKNGLQRAYHSMDQASSLIELASCMVQTHVQIDSLLKLQFKP